MKKPSFFIVGEPKSGTTALYKFLKQHPEIFLPQKEPHYFSKDFHDESDAFHKKKKHFHVRTEEEFMSLFSNWKDEKIAGEASVGYLRSLVAAWEIHKFNPQTKIIAMFREPVDCLYSGHSELQTHLAEDITDFRKALEMEQERKKGRYLPKTIRLPRNLFYSERVRYSEHMQRYLDLFGKKQIKIIIFENFKRDNVGVYKEVLKFLEVDTSFVPDLKVYNPNEKIRSPLIRPLMKIARVIGRLIVPRIPLLNRFKTKIYKGLFLKKTERPPLDPEFRMQLMHRFKPEVEKLGKLIGQDLVTLWGYDRL